MKPRLAAAVATVLALPLLTLLGSATPATAGPPAGPEIRVNTATAGVQERPAVAMDAVGDFVVAWSGHGAGGINGIYAQRYGADGSPRGGEIHVNTFSNDTQYGARVAMDADGDFVVVWRSVGQDGEFSGVYAQRFSASGTPQGVETRVNTTTTGSQDSGSVAMDASGDYVIAWASSTQDGSQSGVYAQRYRADGTPQGVETRVNSTTAGSQDEPSVAASAGGDYVITWTSDGQDGDAAGIYSQRYLADGTTDGFETPVNTTTAGAQFWARAAMAADGDYVVAWTGTETPGASQGIWAQRFNASGVPVGAEVHVNTTTMYDQSLAEVAMAADGGYVITWHSPDGNDTGIYSRRYNPAGSAQGGESRVNTTTSLMQRQPTIAMDADGDYVIAWTSDAQDGDSYGVFARRFRSANGVDLAVTQSDDADLVAVGAPVTYRILVANQEEPSLDVGVPAIDQAVGLATGAYVVSTIPDGADFVTGTGRGWDCTAFESLVRCRYGDPLMAGEVAPPLSLTYDAPKQAGPMLHRARVYEQQLDPDTSNDTETERTAVRCSIELANPSYPTLEAGTLSVLVTRHGSGCGTSSVQYETVGGTATEGSDYSGVADTLTWTDADTDLSFAVPILPDSIDEKTEQLKLRLSNPTGAVLGRRTLANASIADNDPPPRINFTTTSSTAGEPGALVHVTAELSEESGQQVTVDLTRTGTATAGADYFSATKLTIPAGRTSVTFTVEVVDDLTVESNETAVLTFAAPVGATIGGQRTYRLTITSND
ncbi:Calx-beta domain-containing protein [Nocardioides sp. MH1]|uniref:Calx-beta domain-containing protein n=1 Tax=Nocardioides sp. MH1 TaxID=3242490 RepID=UPI003522DAC3